MGWMARLKRLSVSALLFAPNEIGWIRLLRPAFCDPLLGIGLSAIPPYPTQARSELVLQTCYIAVFAFFRFQTT